jgi:hypothetical protein
MTFGCSLKQAWGEDFSPPVQKSPEPGSKRSQNRAYVLPHPGNGTAPEPPQPPFGIVAGGGLADPGVQKMLLYLISGACLIVAIDKLTKRG